MPQMQYMWLVWVVIAGLMFIGEIVTVTFLLFWIGIAALGAMVLALLGLNIYVQFISFAVLATLLIVYTKPLLDKYLKNNNTIKTNASSIEGKKGLVMIEIDNIKGSGQVKVGGELWSASCELPTEIIPVGAEIDVVRLEGVRVIVSPVRILENK